MTAAINHAADDEHLAAIHQHWMTDLDITPVDTLYLAELAAECGMRLDALIQHIKT